MASPTTPASQQPFPPPPNTPPPNPDPTPVLQGSQPKDQQQEQPNDQPEDQPKTAAEHIRKFKPTPGTTVCDPDQAQVRAITDINRYNLVVQAAAYFTTTDEVVVIAPQGILSLATSAQAVALVPQSQVEVLLIGLWPDVENLCLAIRHLRALLPSVRAYGLLVLDEWGPDLYSEGLDLARQIGSCARTVSCGSSPRPLPIPSGMRQWTWRAPPGRTTGWLTSAHCG